MGSFYFSLPPILRNAMTESQGSKLLIISPLVSLADSTKEAIIKMGIPAVCWKDLKPEDFTTRYQENKPPICICSPEHLQSTEWRDVLGSFWQPNYAAWDEAQCTVHWKFRAYTQDIIDWFRSTFPDCLHIFTSATLG